jgi:hypothetical protein
MHVVDESTHTINVDDEQFPLRQRRSKTVSCETKDIYRKRSDQRAFLNVNYLDKIRRTELISARSSQPLSNVDEYSDTI